MAAPGIPGSVQCPLFCKNWKWSVLLWFKYKQSSHYLQICAMVLVLLLIYLVTDMYEGKRAKWTSFWRLMERKLRHLYKACPQDTEGLMCNRSYLDGKFWEKRLSKLCKSRHPCAMLRPELFFPLSNIMRTTLHWTEHILLNDSKQDCFWRNL